MGVYSSGIRRSCHRLRAGVAQLSASLDEKRERAGFVNRVRGWKTMLRRTAETEDGRGRKHMARGVGESGNQDGQEQTGFRGVLLIEINIINIFFFSGDLRVWVRIVRPMPN